MSCPGGRSCHPRPWLTHGSGMFTHLDPLALPPAGSHRLNIPHKGLGPSLWCSSWRLHMFFSYPVSRRSGSHNTNSHSHKRDIHIFSHFLLYIKCCPLTWTIWAAHIHTHTQTQGNTFFCLSFPSWESGHKSTTGEMLTLFEQYKPYICLQYYHISRKLATRYMSSKAIVYAEEPFQRQTLHHHSYQPHRDK